MSEPIKIIDKERKLRLNANNGKTEQDINELCNTRIKNYIKMVKFAHDLKKLYEKA
jgi:signal recognition particle GTPase